MDIKIPCGCYDDTSCCGECYRARALGQQMPPPPDDETGRAVFVALSRARGAMETFARSIDASARRAQDGGFTESVEGNKRAAAAVRFAQFELCKLAWEVL